MTEYDYKATVETEAGTFTFEGDDPRKISAQAARMPVVMHRKQIETRTDLDCPIHRYLGVIAEEENEEKAELE